jgi:hypothetical protein
MFLDLAFEGVEQILNFRVHVGRIVNRLPDLSAKKLPKSLPHPMYGDFRSDFRHPKLSSDIAQDCLITLSSQEDLELVELVGFAPPFHLSAQSRSRSVKQGQRPLLLVDSIRPVLVPGLVAITAIRLSKINRQHQLSATSFLSPLSVPLVHHEVLERGQQKGTEPSKFPLNSSDILSLEQVCKKALRQIGGLIRVIPLLPQVGVHGVPISLAELLESRISYVGIIIPRRAHRAPMRRRELAFWIVEALIVAAGHPSIIGPFGPWVPERGLESVADVDLRACGQEVRWLDCQVIEGG